MGDWVSHRDSCHNLGNMLGLVGENVVGKRGEAVFLLLERDRRYVSYYFNPPSVRVAFCFTWLFYLMKV